MNDHIPTEGAVTLEEAARGDISERYARVLATAVAPDGRAAVVVLGTNEPPALYPYEVVCYRQQGRWFDGGGSNFIGRGWTSLPDQDNGVHRLVGEAPGAAEVVVGYRGREHLVPVQNGYFIFASWNVPPSDLDARDGPEVVRFVAPDDSAEPAA